VDYLNIPQEMRQYSQWVLWKFEDRDASKPTKVPYSPVTHKHAKVNDPQSWGTFEQCVEILRAPGWYDGLGFVLTEQDPYAFIDLDSTKGEQSAIERQIKIYNEFDSYAERSPSGDGLHIIVKGSIPSGRKRSSIEIYSSLRYMTMTGQVYRDAPINDHNQLLNALHEQMATNNQNGIVYAGLAEQKEEDQVVFERAYKAANGGKFNDLWEGRWNHYYPSQSEADFALVDILAFYTQNRAQISRLFRLSALGQREKAKRDDYLNYMLNKAFDKMLPPVDVEGLQNQIREAMDEKLKQPAPKPQKAEAKPQNDVYSVPPGLLGEIAQFVYAQSPRPVAEISLAAALGMMSGIVGRAYNVSGTGLNQYILLLAKTGRGKEAIKAGPSTLFNYVAKTVPAVKDFVGPSVIASSQAVTKYMASGPKSFISTIGEFGITFAPLMRQNASSAEKGLLKFILDAYNKSGQSDSIEPMIYSDKANNTSTVQAPNLSIIGESTPSTFYSALDEDQISNGLIPRFTIIEYHGHRTPLNENAKTHKPSFELIEKLSALCAHALMLNSQDKVIDVRQSPGAELILRDFNKFCDNKMNNSESPIIDEIWNRAHLKALKLSAILAVGENPYDPTISENAANWAINLINHECSEMTRKFNLGQIGVENDESKQIEKMSKLIKNWIILPWSECKKYCVKSQEVLHAQKIIPFSFLQRQLSCNAVFKKDKMGSTLAMKRVIQTLLDRGDLVEISRAELSKNYGICARCFMIAHPEAFGL
jgi:hypothetical protein